ncbi:cell surface glycoprotein 1-like [Homalodisca vitripennis]|uniref:cell surface glycoprotein 1-like n=1 Tax=Homalodisca vitripennis TaxID=197043 RepID=UPI001EEAC0B2|nr:cell surface glycoprotein 1-like [Homalodisca vitripennis]
MNEQDSSIYPHLYVANTIDLPQEYFTGGFLQQDPVSHLERPEEYVPQLSNMEDHYQQQPSSSTHVFANPMDRHGCMVESTPPTAVTGNEHSDGGEEVQSPVAPTDTRDNNRKGSDGKRRKRASSRSSSSSSVRSSSPKRSGSDGWKKTKERRSRSKSRSQPPCRSPTATRPRESPEKRGNPTPTRPQHPPTCPTAPADPPTAPADPPTAPADPPTAPAEKTRGNQGSQQRTLRVHAPQDAGVRLQSRLTRLRNIIGLHIEEALTGAVRPGGFRS